MPPLDPPPPTTRPMRPVKRTLFEEELLPVTGRDTLTSAPEAAAAAPSAATHPPPCPSLQQYEQEALRRIGGANQDIRERNEKISGAYAELWLKNKDAFRWPGAAAHASTQVGLVMDLCDPNAHRLVADILPDQLFSPPIPTSPVPLPPMPPIGPFKPEGSLGPYPAGRAVKEGALRAIQPVSKETRQMLAEGNLAIYKSIYPASLAYAHGGMAEMDCMSAKMSREERLEFKPLKDAFSDIDKGIALKRNGQGKAGEQLIRQGNLGLINYEQRVVAQPAVFDKHPALTWMMTPFAFGDFDGEPMQVDPSTLSTYWPKHAPKSLGNVDERVRWISKDVFPVWYKQYEDHPATTIQRMERIRNRGREAGGNY